MKAAPFDYILADSLEHALELLGQHGDEVKLIAGGQSLVPMMALRLARPALLVDINRLDVLKTIDKQIDKVTLGAGVRQCDIEHSPDLAARLPLVRKALPWVGHQQTRNRGTLGGSLVYADPSAELPLSALVLGARLYLQSAAEGERSIAADEFFLGPMFTAIGDEECLSRIDWPVWRGTGLGCAFEETSIRHGDFAMASAACQLQIDAAGAIARLSFGVGGVDGTPLVFADLARGMIGQRLTQTLARDVAQSAARTCDPGSDMHAGADYRRHLAAVLITRVLLQAQAEAAAAAT